MNRLILSVLSLVALFAAQAALAADNHKVDPVHSSVIFRSSHANIGAVYGRFTDFTGTLTLDEADPSKTTFNFEVQAASVDTHQEKRDAHLKSPDFLNAKQYPTITFKSTSVKKSDKANTLDVTGDLTLHGTTKSVTVPVEILGKGQFPPGTPRVGIESIFTIKRGEFGMSGMQGAVGDDVKLIVAFELTKQ